MQLPMHILKSAESNSLGAEEYVAWCAKTGLSAAEASNSLAIQIASDYISGKLNAASSNAQGRVGAVVDKLLDGQHLKGKPTRNRARRHFTRTARHAGSRR
jgi:hypothetical protein